MCTPWKFCQTCNSGSLFVLWNSCSAQCAIRWRKCSCLKTCQNKPTYRRVCQDGRLARFVIVRRLNRRLIFASLLRTYPREQKYILGPKTVCSSLNIVLCGRLWLQRKKMTNYVGGYHMGRAHGLLQVPLTAWLSPGNITDGFRRCCRPRV